MPRIIRGLVPEQVYHVLNRGNNKAQIFHKSGDYGAFLNLLQTGIAKYKVRLFCYCLMPNHFHLLLSPETEHGLSELMQWVMTSHVRRYHSHYGGVGHVWQGRFKSFIVKNDVHLLTVARYIEANPVRAGLALTGGKWGWSSYSESIASKPRRITTALPIELPKDWGEYVDTLMTPSELGKLRTSVARQTPFGDENWQQDVAARYHIESTLRPRGRPPKR